MVYLDTSVLIPLYIAQAESERAHARVSQLKRGIAAISEWTLLEFTSVVGRRVRGGSLSEGEGRTSIDALHRLAADSFQILPPLLLDFHAARRWVAEFAVGLRAADALHLAIAHRAGARLFTFDMGMREAARRFGVGLYR